MKQIAWLLAILALTASIAARRELPPPKPEPESRAVRAKPQPSSEEPPPPWSQCPARLKLNSQSYELKVFLSTDGQPRPGMHGEVVLYPPQGHIDACIDHVWLNRGSLSWSGPVQEEPPGELSPQGIAGRFRGGPAWPAGEVRVRARIQHAGKTFYLRTRTAGGRTAPL